MLKILITGTPGTGKSTLIEALLRRFQDNSINSLVFSLNEFIKSRQLYEDFDSTYDSYVIDDHFVKKKVIEYFNSLETSGYSVVLIETHTVSTLPKKLVDLVFVLTSRTDVLYDRLKERNYSDWKVQENVQCEIMNIVHEESLERFGSSKVQVLKSNLDEDINDNIEQILESCASLSDTSIEFK